VFKLEAKVMAFILFGPILLGLLAGLIGPRLMNRMYNVKISCYLKPDEPGKNEKFTNAIEGIFAKLKNVEEITSTTTEESIVLKIKINFLEDIRSTKFIDEEIKRIVGDRLVKIEIDI
jgi:hypothetical protein